MVLKWCQMPSLNLRLSDDELNALREWARSGGRSVQREIVYRLFSGLKLPAATLPVEAPEPGFALLPPGEGADTGGVGDLAETGTAVGDSSREPVRRPQSLRNAKKRKRSTEPLCVHRVPLTSFCKRCDV